MRRRRGLILGVASAAALATVLVTLVPLPARWDPREDEVPPGRYAELARFSGTRTADEVASALSLLDPQRELAPFYTLSRQTLAIRIRADGPVAVLIALRDRPAPPRPPLAWP